MKRLLIAITPLLFVPSNVLASDNCNVATIRTIDNVAVDGYMTARTGKRCTIKMISSAGPTTDTRIVRSAAYGSASAAGHVIAYASKAGYTGADEFAYARSGTDRFGRPSVRTVNVHVTVIP